MTPDPPPLSEGRTLANRFELRKVLGRGGFGIAYLAEDSRRGDQVVIKELAPIGVRRDAEGNLDLDRSGSPGHLMRHRFLQEAEVLRRLHHPGVPNLRATFSENGTAYFVTNYIPGARTLEDRLRREGRFAEEEAREIFVSVLDILESVHMAGVLHRDIKPSNILLGPAGEVVLIDFGAARDWLADLPVTHTVMHTPGYAPPEQMSERAQRGPATDLYGLCATTYYALAGKPPPSASDRLAEIPLVPLEDFRPGLDPGFTNAIEQGLRIRLGDRPQTVEEIRNLLRDDQIETFEMTLQKLDETLLKLQTFRCGKRACPACDGTLIEPKPLKRLVCPVCQNGVIQFRDLDDRKCPECRIGQLQTLDNRSSLSICPSCSIGQLIWRKKSLLGLSKAADCPNCQAHFENDGPIVRGGTSERTPAEWNAISGRGEFVRFCPECGAQFDATTDSRWRQTVPISTAKATHTIEEWARIAARLSPSAGNAECANCSADYWREDARLTLLESPRDPQGFAARYVGRALPIEDVRWLGVGKSSGEPGLLCDTCPTEFDRVGEYLRLVDSPNRKMTRHLGEPRILEDWHRIARELPTIDQESQFESDLDPLLRSAYRSGDLSFDDRETSWRGKAIRLADSVENTFLADAAEISFGGRFRRWKVPLDAVLGIEFTEDEVWLSLSGHSDPIGFHIYPVDLTAHLKSGNLTLRLTAEDLADRLGHAIGPSDMADPRFERLTQYPRFNPSLDSN